MRFVVDAQLPPALARWLVDHGYEAVHVVDIGMEASTGRMIWQYAGARDAIILSKDEDFVSLRMIDPSGPMVLWVRIGNTTKAHLLEKFCEAMPRIEGAFSAGEALVELS